MEEILKPICRNGYNIYHGRVLNAKDEIMFINAVKTLPVMEQRVYNKVDIDFN